ncbi:hypothetical protein AM500_08020 [Bacillus sp. FJAT-18017]|nr:hypothetical protein AM500_08020 [Bacillus sp. FJAT-18017]
MPYGYEARGQTNQMLYRYVYQIMKSPDQNMPLTYYVLLLVRARFEKGLFRMGLDCVMIISLSRINMKGKRR